MRQRVKGWCGERRGLKEWCPWRERGMGVLHLGPTLKGLPSGLKDKMNSEEAAVLPVYSDNSGAPVEVERKKPHSCGTSKAEPRLKEGQYQ